jgi:GLPGLI family protein
MKRIILSAFLSLVAIAQLSAQKEYTTTYQIEYEVTYSLDSLNRDLTDTDKLYLYTGSNYGVFINYNAIQREKVVEKMKRKYGNHVSMGIEYSSSSNNPSFRKTFYKDLQ